MLLIEGGVVSAALAAAETENAQFNLINRAWNFRMVTMTECHYDRHRVAQALHCAAAAVGGFIIEYSAGGGNPLINELARERFPIVEGYLEIPDRPGLGVTVDESVVTRYRKAWRPLPPANGR